MVTQLLSHRLLQVAMSNIYGQKCLFPQNHLQYQQYLGYELYEVLPNKSTANLVLVFEMPTLHRRYSNQFLHLWSIRSLKVDIIALFTNNVRE